MSFRFSLHCGTFLTTLQNLVPSREFHPLFWQKKCAGNEIAFYCLIVVSNLFGTINFARKQIFLNLYSQKSIIFLSEQLILPALFPKTRHVTCFAPV